MGTAKKLAFFLWHEPGGGPAADAEAVEALAKTFAAERCVYGEEDPTVVLAKCVLARFEKAGGQTAPPRGTCSLQPTMTHTAREGGLTLEKEDESFPDDLSDMSMPSVD